VTTSSVPSACWTTDLYTQALRTGRGPLYLRRADGWLLPLDVERWCSRPDVADRSVLRRCRGSVLDIGCGPGRIVTELARRGTRILGIDTSPAAVARARDGGGNAELASVFDVLPDEGHWHTGLLLDGNIGIGGDPAALLTRLREVIAPGGSVVAEAAPQDVDERVHACLDDGRGSRSPSFPWARAGGNALAAHAERAGWYLADQWTASGRPFLLLRHHQAATVTSSTAATSSAQLRG
jgi:SAM-dependent methyltransferase